VSHEEQEGRNRMGGDGAGERAGDEDEGQNGTAATPGDQVAALAAERDEMKDRMLRVAAEFENWKRRARKEQDDAENKAREAVLRDMLDVIDNLERAVGAFGEGAPGGAAAPKTGAAPAQPQDAAAVLKGVGLVLRLFQSKLERYQVKPFAARGEPFDPRIHEAISKVATADVPPNAVAVELQRGYRIGERLLRPAMVSVATAPAAGDGKGTGGSEGGGH
jgi:molecular chaperone GrpE